MPLPCKCALAPVKYWRQLPLRPFGIPLPQPAKSVSHRVRNWYGQEGSHLLFVSSQERPARWQLIIDNIEHLALSSFYKPGEHNSLGAIVDVSQGQLSASPQVHEKPK